MILKRLPAFSIDSLWCFRKCIKAELYLKLKKKQTKEHATKRQKQHAVLISENRSISGAKNGKVKSS